MKIKSKKIIFIIIIAFAMLFTTKSYGSVAIKKGTTTYTNQTISYFFDECRNMTNSLQGLEGTSLDPHMATNKEWATVSYFSNSIYGTNREGKNTGTSITIDEREYYSTNGNVTGVMDWGKNHTFTAGVNKNYEESTVKANGKSVLDSVGTTYVDIGYDDRDLIAAKGYYSAALSVNENTRGTYTVRKGLFGFLAGWGGYNGVYCHGGARDDTTFRPII